MPTLEKTVERHVMVDIETLSTDNNAFITSIAAVAFDPLTGTTSPHGVKKWIIDPWAEQPGAVIDIATVVWRQQQGEESKQDLRRPQSEFVLLPDALDELRKFLNEAIVWANSPEFDLVIINNAAKRYGQGLVTKYWTHRDVRTQKMLLEQLSGDEVKDGKSHDPVEDCFNQIRYVVVPVYKELYGRRLGERSACAGGLGSNEFTGDKVSYAVDSN